MVDTVYNELSPKKTIFWGGASLMSKCDIWRESAEEYEWIVISMFIESVWLTLVERIERESHKLLE